MAKVLFCVPLALTIFSFFCLIPCFALASENNSNGCLRYGFYDESCPDAERIIFNAVADKFSEAPESTAGALRIFFHDCFVEGCDASVLIVSSSTTKAERDAEINLSLSANGFDLFFRAKEAVESQCPKKVSCADVMTIATRDCVYMLGGPRFEVQTGRRDGLTSEASTVLANIPQPNQTLSQIISLFKSKGLSVLDMVVLSGAHTIGASHCKEFMNRIYSYNASFEIDPTMDQKYAKKLRETCPERKLDPTVLAFNDVTTPLDFDNAYYSNLQKGLGLLGTDQILALDPRSRAYVDLMAKDNQVFVSHFIKSVVKLGTVGVKTGEEGEIRHYCGSFNT
ncbi:hypothetical protein Tsubulata_936744 [Turnera subulata]|uniref:Peroxidase n=1 Tax=Turnera subulata TaxID=218843 RepID=A0A9Q0FH50_9ROSI|nr:hypothetical protein Tsubulata_936744 [Turnera subulata]